MGLVTIFGYLHMRATRTVLAIQGSLPVAFRGGGGIPSCVRLLLFARLCLPAVPKPSEINDPLPVNDEGSDFRGRSVFCIGSGGSATAVGSSVSCLGLGGFWNRVSSLAHFT